MVVASIDGDAAKSAIGDFLAMCQEKMWMARDLIFGKDEESDDMETMSLRSVRSSRSSRKKSSVNNKIRFDYTEYDDLNTNLDTSRNLVVSSDTLFRKGPIPIEKLAYSDQIHLSLKACLEELDDSKKTKIEEEVIQPADKMLLTYFARLGSGEDDEDSVNIQFVQSLLDGGASFNFCDQYGQSIFFAVVRDWHIDVARFALDRGADINHQDKYGRTALHLAASVDYKEMVEFLLKNDADIDAVTKGEKLSPLHYAARYDAVESIKVLIQYGATIDSLDFIDRTPLHVAAEYGSEKAVRYFLKLGAPVGVYDTYANSAMSMIVEKLPNLAYEALNQFIVEDNAMRRKYYYLDRLEFNAKISASKDGISVLKTIVMYDQLDLIMHPAIRKLLDVHWSLFGKRHAIISNFWNILYTIIATILTYSIPYHSYDRQFHPPKEQSWKIALACIFFVLTFYFWIKQILLVRSNGQRVVTYKDYRLMRARKQHEYHHPRWFEEEQFYREECHRINRQKSAFWQDPWNIFEWISLIFVLLMFALHIINVLKPDKTVFKVAKLISAISLLLVYFRLYKTLRIFLLFSEFTVLIGNIFKETIRILLIFMDFYIPFVFIMYMMFGGDHILESTFYNESMKNLVDVAYTMWSLTFATPVPMQPEDTGHRVVAELAVGLYFLLMTVLFVYIYIGRMSQTFALLYRHALAKATMVLAKIIVQEDYSLSVRGKMRQRKYLRHSCGPMVLPFEGVIDNTTDERENMLIGINHVTTKINEMSAFLARSSFDKDQNRTINLDHLSVFNTEVEKLSQKQHDNELELSTSKKKLAKEQQKALDMIRETVQARTNNAMMKKRRAGKADG